MYPDRKKMVKVYYAKVSEFTKLFHQPIDLVKFIPKEFHKEALKYIRPQDQFSFIIGRLLIMKLLRFFGYNAIEIINLKKTKHNKPYFSNLFSFNLSHSGDYVICCGSKKHNLGIDIEKKKQLDISDFKTAFSSKELEIIHSTPDSLGEFFKIWAKKESIIKADGRGLTIDLTKISLSENKAIIDKSDAIWHLKSLDISEEYSCYICSDKEITSIDVHEFLPDMVHQLTNLQ
jgi:4'-phosphopantetheinyl transferase